MFGIVIDKQGYKIEFVVLNEDGTPQYYKLKEDESIIEEEWHIANSMNKPQRVNGKWIDTDPLPPQPEVPQEPNEMEVLERENKQLWDTVELLLKVNGFLPSEDPIYQIKE